MEGKTLCSLALMASALLFIIVELGFLVRFYFAVNLCEDMYYYISSPCVIIGPLRSKQKPFFAIVILLKIWHVHVCFRKFYAGSFNCIN